MPSTCTGLDSFFPAGQLQPRGRPRPTEIPGILLDCDAELLRFVAFPSFFHCFCNILAATVCVNNAPAALLIILGRLLVHLSSIFWPTDTFVNARSSAQLSIASQRRLPFVRGCPPPPQLPLITRPACTEIFDTHTPFPSVDRFLYSFA